MIKPFSVMSGWWRGVLLAVGLAWGASACGDDDASPGAALGPDAGSSALGGAAGESGAGGSAGAAGAPAQTCEPGATRPCEQDLLCSGVETCAADGSGFGACDCGTAELVGSGTIGASCENDVDCAAGGTCLAEATTAWRGVSAGPAGGYCTFPCTDTAECEARDSQSTCLSFAPGEGSYCIRTCLSKEPEPGEAKCLNRPDVSCVSVVAQGIEVLSSERQSGYCGPRCGSDADCTDGRFCHRGAGLCAASPSPGVPIGSRCTVSTDCDGNSCEDRDSENVGTCTALCVLGSLNGCGYSSDANPREAACLTPLVAAGRFSEGPGDLGLCRELCDVAADCQRALEGWICSPLSEQLAAFVGRSGACTQP